MSRRSPVSFVGPVTTIAGQGSHFEIMSAQGGVLRLEYTSPEEAKEARDDLAGPSTTHKVSHHPLFDAMKQLIQVDMSKEDAA